MGKYNLRINFFYDDEDDIYEFGIEVPKNVTIDEVEEMLKNGEISKALYLYSDGTEAYIDENILWENLMNHYDNGGKFAIEF